MSSEISALLIFCEGPHDTAFVRMVLKKLIGYKIQKLKLSEMPSPFDKLFKTAIETHAATDMSLDMTHKFFLPDTILRKNDDVVFIFNCGGKTQYDKIRNLLSDYIPVLEHSKTFSKGANEIAASVKYLFLYDSDAEGINSIVNNLDREFKHVADIQFINDTWLDSRSKFGKISKDKAVFVWGGSPEKGTLEDILLPMFSHTTSNTDLIEKASSTIKEMFSWELDTKDLERSVAEHEKLQKAILTIVGQREKPGSSLNVILEQSSLITKEALQACVITSEFVDFVTRFTQA